MENPTAQCGNSQPQDHGTGAVAPSMGDLPMASLHTRRREIVFQLKPPESLIMS